MPSSYESSSSGMMRLEEGSTFLFLIALNEAGNDPSTTVASYLNCEVAHMVEARLNSI